MTTTAPDTDHGHVAAGFEPVRDVLTASSLIRDGGAAFAAYVDGELIVDVRAGVAKPGLPWQADTLAVLMSITKSFMAFCVQLLDDRGEIDLDEKVAHYWPEFAAADKEEITVRQLLLHTAGVIRVPPQLRLMECDGEGWDDYEAIAAALAAEPPVWPPGTQHGYHALTFGWLVGEVVRRITGVSPGTFFRREVIDPLGLDIRIAATDADLARTASVLDFDRSELGGVQRIMVPRLMRRMTDPTTYAGMAMAGNGESSVILRAVEMMTHGGILRAEVMSSSGLATASGLARFFSVLALGGELDGKRLVSEASVRKWSEPQITAGDVTVTASMPKWVVKAGKLEQTTAVSRTLGYLSSDLPPKAAQWFGPVRGAIGGLGAGGQVGFADPARGVSIGFVRNALTNKPDLSTALISTFYNCLNERSE